jgi:hypothetical protein
MLRWRPGALALLFPLGLLAGSLVRAAEDPTVLRARAEMVERQLAGRDIRDPLVPRVIHSAGGANALSTAGDDR